MRYKNSFKLVAASSVWLFFVGNLSAKISLLSYWNLQDHLATPEGKMDQGAGIQFGINGVSPSGSDTDTNFVSFPYHLTYGLSKQFEIGAAWGFQWVDRKDKNSQFGISDLVVASRYRFFDPNRSERTPGLDVEAGFSFPTGSFEKGLGTGGLGILFGWGLVLPLDPLRAHFGMGFKLYTKNSDDIQVGNVFSYHGGFTYPLKVKALKEKVSLTAELKGFNHARNRKDDKSEGAAPDELYLSPGALWKLHQKFQFSVALLIGLTTHSSDVGMNLELQF